MDIEQSKQQYVDAMMETQREASAKVKQDSSRLQLLGVVQISGSMSGQEGPSPGWLAQDLLRLAITPPPERWKRNPPTTLLSTG